MLALVLAACGDVVSGGPCSATKHCSGNEVCDMTDPDGAKCVSGDGDEDGDGLPNKRDFCQHQAGGQFDEDLDGIGDDCDACPVAPPPAIADTDGDGVDSPCDPYPTTPGDKIVLFNGFNDPTLPNGWKTSAAWTIQGGEAKVVPAGATSVETLSGPLPGVSTKISLLTQYRVDGVESGATEIDATVVGIDQRPAGVTTIVCGGSRVGTMDRLLLDTGVSGATDPMTQLFDTAGLYRVAMKLEGAQAQCALIADRDTGAAQANSAGEAMTSGGVSARGAMIRFSYVLVVQHDPLAPN